MPILFSAVACDRNVIVNFASCDGNFLEIAEQVLSKIPGQNNKMTYSHGIYLLHYITQDKYCYLCITDRLCQRSRAFLFLNEIQRRYEASKEYSTKVIAAEMYRYSQDYSTITIRQGELDELNNIGVACSDSILGEKILYIRNPDNVSYSTISYVDKTPGKISISAATPRMYTAVIGVLIVFIGFTVYTFEPISCAVIICVGAFTLIKYFFGTKSKTE